MGGKKPLRMNFEIAESAHRKPLTGFGSGAGGKGGRNLSCYLGSALMYPLKWRACMPITKQMMATIFSLQLRYSLREP